MSGKGLPAMSIAAPPAGDRASALRRDVRSNPAELDAIALLGQRALLASVSRTGADGVAHVARLLERAIGDLTGRRPTALDLEPRRTDGVSLAERGRFSARLLAGQLFGRPAFSLFSHLSLAQAQLAVPRRVRAPYAVFLHGIEAWGAPLTPGRLAAVEGAALLISNSRYTADRMARAYPTLSHVFPCPLALLPAHTPVGAPDAALLERVRPESVLIVGRMNAAERYKGHDELLDAWPGLRELVPGAQLVVAGGGDDVPRLRERSRELGLGESVLFAGRVSDATLDRLYERSAVFAMPSRGEGFGIVYLEAMRAGKPCVASADDGGADVVVDGETGVLVPRRDRRTLVAALALLLGNPERARAMGAAGRRRFDAEFTFERFRDRLGVALASAFGRGESGER